MRIVWTSVLVGAVAGGALMLWIVDVHGGSAWWAAPAVVVLGFVPGTVVGALFGAHDRELAIPTPLAAGFVAFVFALLTPFAVYGVYLILWLIHTGTDL